MIGQKPYLLDQSIKEFLSIKCNIYFSEPLHYPAPRISYIDKRLPQSIELTPTPFPHPTLEFIKKYCVWNYTMSIHFMGKIEKVISRKTVTQLKYNSQQV